MESSWVGPNFEEVFRYLVGGVKNWYCDFLLWRDDNYIHKTDHDRICREKRLACITVENNYCSSYISHEITSMWSIINIISCGTSIDYVDSHTPYFDVFVCWYWSMPEELMNTTTQLIISYAEDPYGILIG